MNNFEKTKDRVSAVIIKNKKLLLVTGYDESFYWTPGGKISKEENKEDALKRELYEELKIKVIDIKPYFEYKTTNELYKIKQKVYCFLVEIDGNIKPSAEITKYAWVSKEDIKKINFPKGIKDNLIPKILNDKLI